MQLRSGSPQFAHRLRVYAWEDFMGGKHNWVKEKFFLKVSWEDSLERHIVRSLFVKNGRFPGCSFHLFKTFAALAWLVENDRLV